MLAASACSPPISHADRADDNAEAVEKVERLSTPPALPLSLEEITYPDLDGYNMFGAGCYFLDNAGKTAGENAPMLFIANDSKGWLKLDGKVVELAADRSSDQLPYMAWTKYVGLARTVSLERENGKARSLGEESETETAPGKIIIRDEMDRVVYTREGSIDCGA